MFSAYKSKLSKFINLDFYILAVFSLLSLFISIVTHQMFLARASASLELDMYYAAFKLPDILFAALASIISPFMILPFLREDFKKNNYDLLFSVLNLYLIVSLVVATLAFLFAPFYAKTFFAEIYNQSAESFVFLIRLLLLQFIFIGAAQIFMAVLQYKKQFVDYAIAPIIYKSSILIAFYTFYDYLGMQSAVYGAIFGALLYLIYVVFRSRVLLQKLRLKSNIKNALYIIKSTYPRSLSLMLQEIFITSYYSFLSLFSVGAISIFQVAYSLQSIFQTIISSSYTTASFPDLADAYADKNMHKYITIVEKSIKQMLFWFFPIIAIACALGFEAVKYVFVRGNFTLAHAEHLYAIFIILLLAFPAQAISMVLARAFYAAKLAFDVFVAHFIILIFSIVAFFVYSYIKIGVSHIMWASYMFVFSQYFLMFYLYIRFRKLFVKISFKHILKNNTLVISALAAFVSVLIFKYLNMNKYNVIVSAVVFTFIYVLILYIFDNDTRNKIKSLLIK